MKDIKQYPRTSKKNLTKFGTFLKEVYSRNPRKFIPLTRNKNLTSLARSSLSRIVRTFCRTGKQTTRYSRYFRFTAKELIASFEKQFKNGMNWGNYATTWQIDHIIPICAFQYLNVDDEGYEKCWALDNLQPLLILENTIKSSN